MDSMCVHHRIDKAVANYAVHSLFTAFFVD